MSGDFDDLPFDYGTAERPATAPPRRCTHPKRYRQQMTDGTHACGRCGHILDPDRARRGRGNRSRGGAEELIIARLLGGRKIGPLGLPHDVEAEGYRLQSKRLAGWPSLAQVVSWIDEMQPHDDIRGVTVALAPGQGRKIRRLLIVDLDEYVRHR